MRSFSRMLLFLLEAKAPEADTAPDVANVSPVLGDVGDVAAELSSRMSSLEPRIFILSDFVRPTLLAFLGNCRVLEEPVEGRRESKKSGLLRVSMIF